MHGVQPQAVGVEVAHPSQRAVDDIVANLVGVGAGDIDAVPPRVAGRRQVRAESRQVVARWAEMVEHRVDQHAQTTGMACVDEPDQTVGAAVGFVHAVPQHTVISPTAGSGKGIDRHQLDEVDSEIDQVIQLFDGGVERASRGERADVQLVDHRALDRPPRPASVGPGSTKLAGRLPPLGACVHPVGLAGRSRVG
ncbi:Uncharacterised protein [Mycobacterium tuberculosis]|uniref:Uncharacterized protein n=1 Tax=Mycobacterium tuberculosis TaxID=1773 RepID=A0A655JJJ7_MYCTX|nr:Uncharacterised protein [Mycobacterium tuberculosis]COX02167.1 Uncharacterised protein [Mycobacterium tuberculosis]